MLKTKLLVQPADGTAQLIDAIDNAQEIIQIVIFRFDRSDIEAALRRAARRGVFVHALVAHTSVGQGGDATLRKVETRLLADGVSVARTASDLLRYHGKLMIVDRETLFLLAFNYTHIDIARSRSFGIVTDCKEWVEEAERLFEADTLRQPYEHNCPTFIVSPVNARRELTAMLAAAKRQILIYDDKLSDPKIMRLVVDKVREGLDVRLIGAVGLRAASLRVAPLYMRLHGQVIICDSEQMFLGSQSLRSTELDSRREVGLIIREEEIVQQVKAIFEADCIKIHEARLTCSPEAVVYDPDSIDRGSVDRNSIDIESLQEREIPAITPELVRMTVKEAIKDAVLEMPSQLEVVLLPLKKVVNSAVKEALHELAQ